MTFRLRTYTPLLLTLFIILLDRITKVAVASYLHLGRPKDILGDLVRFNYVQNTGMAFGYKILGIQVLAVISLIAVFVVIIILVRMGDQPRGVRWILAAILGGAIGNTYDRFVYGYVVDFIDIKMPHWLMDRFAVFNVADSAVSVGVTLLLLLLLFQKDPETGQKESEVSGEADISKGEDDSIHPAGEMDAAPASSIADGDTPLNPTTGQEVKG